MEADGSIETEGLHGQDIDWLREFLFLRAFPGQTHEDFETTPTHAVRMLTEIDNIFKRKRAASAPSGPPGEGGAGPHVFGGEG